MLKNYLKIAFRNFYKNKIFVLINILGLGLALACCIVAYLNWDYNESYDTNHVNADKIYRVNFVRITNGRPIKNGSSPLPIGSHIKDNISQVGKVIRFTPLSGNFKVKDEVFRTSLVAVDPAFFNTFTFPLLAGNNEQIEDKRSVFISEELARKYFSDVSSAMGETLQYISGDKKLDFKVAAVFEKPPKNSSFYAQAYFHYDNAFDLTGWEETDWSKFNNTFVTIGTPANVPVVEKQLQQFVAVQNKAKEDYKVSEYYLDPFVGLAVRSEREDIWNHWLRQSLPTSAAIAPGIMALLLLLLACFNFTNTSIAIANRRIKEIGIRKVMGSSKTQIIIQFLGENLLLCFFSFVGRLDNGFLSRTGLQCSVAIP